MIDAHGGSGRFYLQWFAVLGFLSVLLLRQVSDPDIWCYLVVGREIANTLAIPTHEFYLFPAIGEPGMFSALGYGMMHYGAYWLAGYAGVAVVNALLVAGGLTILMRAASRRCA